MEAIRHAGGECAAWSETGLVKLVLGLEKLRVVGRALQVGAHPDDEDNSLLAYLSKGLHLDTFYLVANWGEGGQNEIGPELYDALGLLRREELAAARAIDGASQLHLGTRDFGFCKSGAEALARWGHEACLARLVEVFRRFRPEIVLTHHDTVSGHGQHQAVGTLLLEAWEASADPQAFPEQLTRLGLHPWQVKKLYLRVAPDEATVQVDVGEYSPLLGRSYHELGMLSRSMHRSQGMGGPAPKGAVFRPYRLLRSAVDGLACPEGSLLDGLDVSLAALAAGLSGEPEVLAELRQEVAGLERAVEGVSAAFDLWAPWAVAEELVAGLRRLRDLRRRAAGLALAEHSRALLTQRLADKERDFVRVIQDLAAVALDIRTASREVVPGEPVALTAELWNRGRLPVEQARLRLVVPEGWALGGGEGRAADVPGNQRAEEPFAVRVPPEARGAAAGGTGPVEVVAEWRLLGEEIVTSVAAELAVVPRVAVWLEPERLVFPAGAEGGRCPVVVRLRNNTRIGLGGRVRLEAPAGWTVRGDAAFLLEGGGETSVRLDLGAPEGAGAGRYGLSAVAEYAGGESDTGYQVIAYPHIRRQYLFRRAEAELAVVDARVAPGLRVGYVHSGFDRVAERLRDLGVEVEFLDERALNAGDLARFDTIVLGIRAYRARPDLVANNQRLLDYVRDGGQLVVQYHKAAEWQPHLAPFPLELGPARVTHAEAPVTVLDPEQPLFRWPNHVSAADWEGWVQERGLYFAASWAPAYRPLVALADPGEPRQEGAWLAAAYGRGTYVYTALAWYRKLEALVPGAYRLFANLVSLPRVAKLP